MSNGKKKLLLNTTAVSLGCSSCRRIKLSNIFHPKPRYKKPTSSSNNYRRRSSSTSWNTTPTTTTTAATFSPNTETPPYYSSDSSDSDIRCLRAVQGFGRVGGDSLAVEKESDDPYLDFRQSMLQMILEKEIYSKEDLRELLNCFLQLNSPYHHGIIIRAFTEIWNGVFSSKLHGGQQQQMLPMSRDF